MSGGSYDYLCFADPGDVLNKPDTVRAMAARLDDLGVHDAAAETRILLAMANQLEAHIERLADIWHAVEWHDSGDYGRAQVETAALKYRGES